MGRLRAASYHRAFQASKKPGCTLSAAGFIELFLITQRLLQHIR